MKTILTLKTSSMFFVGSVNLYKGVPTQVDTDNLSASTLRMVNQAITSGKIESADGLLEAPVKEEAIVEDTPARDETPVVVETVKTEPKVTEDEAPAAVEVKTPTKKKTATTKKKTSE